jgi:hypothetical protein
MNPIFCKLATHKDMPQNSITKQMCIDWGMVATDKVFTGDNQFKKTIGNVYQYPKSTLEIRFGAAYSNVQNDECAGIWDWV